MRRCGQLNLNERDPLTLDVSSWLDYWASLELDALLLNGGGIVAFYPTAVPYHHRSKSLTPEQTLELTYRLHQYGGEQSLDRIPHEGLSADYVRRETRRAVAGVSSKVKIWPGIDIDIPTGPNEKKTAPDDVYAAVKAAFDGGAHGVLLSRKYSEMPLANLRAAGRAVRDLKVG